MRETILLMFAYFSFSIICYGQNIEEFQVIEKGENISDIDFGKDSDLFVLNYNDQVKKISIDSTIQSYKFNVNAKSFGVANTTKKFAFGKSDGDLLIFENQEIVKSIGAHRDVITSIAFSLSDQYIATSSLDSTIKIWSANTYKLLHEINTNSDLVTDLKFSLDNKFLVYSTNTGMVFIWSLSEEDVLSTYQISNDWIRNIAISPDSTKFAVCGDDKKITVFSFKNNDYYQLKKSHRNIISSLAFINKDYLISIGQDNRIVMNNINIPTEKAELKHFRSYARYKRYFNVITGDKYFSDLSISNEKKVVAVSSYGKGITLTNYFHDLIENPHVIKIKEIDNNTLDTVNIKSEFHVKKGSSVIIGRITRLEEIKNAWLYFVDEDEKAKLKFNKKGEFKVQVPILNETNDFTIIVEDWDKNLKIIRHDFRLTLKD